MSYDILIVDDEQDIRDLIAGILEDEGYKTRLAKDGLEALHLIKTRQPSLIVLDVWLGDSERDGLKILDVIKRDHPYVPVIMISGHATIETAVSAIKKGAYDFIEKPFKADRLLLVIERALESANLKRENNELKIQTAFSETLIGSSSSINHVRQTIDKCAVSNSRVFITGPMGVGKELVARQIHKKSLRSKGPFIYLSCAAFHPDKLEAELFGTEIMNNPNNLPRKIGVLEQAHHGTLFLDDIHELALPTQGKLVRFLQEQSFVRLGGEEKIQVDVRVIAATTCDIQQAIQQGDFREDLYYRLNVSHIHLPALKERVIDIPALCQYFMESVAKAHNLPIRKLNDDTLVVLQSYAWPGNVKQLKNLIEWIYIMSNGDPKEPVTAQSLPTDIIGGTQISSQWNVDMVSLPLREAREAFEREYLFAQVNRFGGNISQTARFVGMERSALHRKLKTLTEGRNIKHLDSLNELEQDNSSSQEESPLYS